MHHNIWILLHPLQSKALSYVQVVMMSFQLQKFFLTTNSQRERGDQEEGLSGDHQTPNKTKTGDLTGGAQDHNQSSTGMSSFTWALEPPYVGGGECESLPSVHSALGGLGCSASSSPQYKNGLFLYRGLNLFKMLRVLS